MIASYCANKICGGDVAVLFVKVVLIFVEYVWSLIAHCSALYNFSISFFIFHFIVKCSVSLRPSYSNTYSCLKLRKNMCVCFFLFIFILYWFIHLQSADFHQCSMLMRTYFYNQFCGCSIHIQFECKWHGKNVINIGVEKKNIGEQIEVKKFWHTFRISYDCLLAEFKWNFQPIQIFFFFFFLQIHMNFIVKVSRIIPKWSDVIYSEGYSIAKCERNAYLGMHYQKWNHFSL